MKVMVRTVRMPVAFLLAAAGISGPAVHAQPVCQFATASFDNCVPGFPGATTHLDLVIIDGDTVATEQRVTSYKVCIYERSGDTFQQIQSIDTLGTGMYHFDGDHLFVDRLNEKTAMFDVWSYKRVGGTFQPQQLLDTGSIFGLSQGRFVNQQMEVWRDEGGGWALEQDLGCCNAFSGAIEGLTVFVRNTFTSYQVFGYDVLTEMWQLEETLEFGPAAAPGYVSIDGNRAYLSGAGIYERDGLSWNHVADILPPSDGGSINIFSGILRGNTLVFESSGFTVGYVYRRQADGTWLDEVKLVDADGNSMEINLAFDGNTVVVARECFGVPAPCTDRYLVYDIAVDPCEAQISGIGATLDFVPDVGFEGVSPDGGTVLGAGVDPNDPGAGAFPVTWTPAGGVMQLDPLPGDTTGSAVGASCHGEIIAGTSGDREGAVTRGFVDTPGGTVVLDPFGTCQISEIAVHALSNDGFVVAGSSTDNANCVLPIFYQGGLQQLPLLPGGTSGEALGVSGDGAVFVGYIDTPGGQRIARWPDFGTTPDDLGAGVACDASYEGFVVVGTTAGGDVFRWTAFDGLVTLGRGTATAVSDEGTTIVGTNENGAFIWRAGTGMVDLPTHLADFGIDTTGFDFTTATDVSPAGNVIVGRATCDSGADVGFVIRVDPVGFGGGDADGDGLLDAWESECGGIDGDGNGTIDLNLFELGARPWHKDLFIEVDAMDGQQMFFTSIQFLTEAFEFAPVAGNPDGDMGITLHVQPDETDLTRVEVWDTGSPDSCWPVDFAAEKAAHFGVPGDSPAVKAARALAFRYCIIAVESSDGAGGCGERPGNDFVVYANAIDDIALASAFMHELGHNLGLQHGGNDDLNYKPNYVSVMNYAINYRYEWNKTFWRLDYSGQDLGTLDETSLNELAGIDSIDGFYDQVRMPFGITTGIREIRYVQLNGGVTDFGSPDGSLEQDGFFDFGVEQDLNWLGASVPNASSPSPGDVLEGHNDWDVLQYAVPQDVAVGGAVYPDELTKTEIQWIDDNFPIPPCLADLDGDGFIGINDFLALLAQWGSDPGGPPDLDGDGNVGITDFLELLAAWGPCA